VTNALFKTDLVFRDNVTSKLFFGGKTDFFTEWTEQGVVAGVKALHVGHVAGQAPHAAVAAAAGPAHLLAPQMT
jgi:hypothetical protein